MVHIYLLPLGNKAGAILASLELIDGIIVALVQGAATIVDALYLLDKASNAETRLGSLILKYTEMK